MVQQDNRKVRNKAKEKRMTHAQEYGLIGSVEFAENYYHVLYDGAVAYLNLDIAVTIVSGLNQADMLSCPYPYVCLHSYT